jgi:hypothetical protein
MHFKSAFQDPPPKPKFNTPLLAIAECMLWYHREFLGLPDPWAKSPLLPSDLSVPHWFLDDEVLLTDRVQARG